MSFQFKTSADIKAAQYEGVKVIPRTPKNPQDFHSIQDIIKYRQVMMINELYGNARIATINNSNPFSITNLNKINVNGVYYFDGYRMEINNIVSDIELTNEQSYDIYLTVTFETVDFKEDSSIALQDSGTGRFIPTSERYRFKYGIVLKTINMIPSLDDFPGVDSFYKLGTAKYNLGGGDPWILSDNIDLPVVSLTYAEAMQIAAASIHVSPDGWTYIEKLATKDTGNRAFIDGSSNVIKIGIKDSTGKEVVALQTLDADGLLPAISLLGGNGKAKISDDRISFESELGSNAEYSSNYIKINTPAAQQFEANDSRLSYFFPFVSGIGFNVSLLSKNTQQQNYPVTLISGDTVIATSTGYEKAAWIYSNPSIDQTAKATYKFLINSQSYPQNGAIDINHLIQIMSGLGSTGNIIAKVYFADSVSIDTPDDSFFQLIKIFSWNISQHVLNSKIVFHPHPENTFGVNIGGPIINQTELPIEPNMLVLDLNTNAKNFVAHFKIEYEVVSQANVSCVVQFKTSVNLSAKKYINPFLLTSADYFRLGNYFLWTDSQGRLRIKRMSDPKNGFIIDGIEGELTDKNTVDSPSGIEVGAGVKTLNNLSGNIIARTTIDNNISAPVLSADNDLNEILLKFPVIGNADVKYGLLSDDRYNMLLTKITEGGTGLQNLNGIIENTQGLSVAINPTVINLPQFIWDTNTQSHVLSFPDPSAAGSGLLSKTNYDMFYKGASSTRPAYSFFVSSEWKNPATGNPITVSNPYFTSIQAAIEAAYTDALSTGKEQTVFVYPGEYTEDILLRNRVNIVAVDMDNTVIVGTVRDVDASDPTVNQFGVSCQLRINIDTSLAETNNIPALEITRVGSVITSYGNLVSRHTALLHYTVSVLGGKLKQYGNIGKVNSEVNSGLGYIGGGINVTSTNGKATAQILGDIFVSSNQNGNHPIGINCDGSTPNKAFVCMRGRIYGKEGINALVHVGSNGNVEINNSLELLTTDAPVIYNEGTVYIRNAKIYKNSNTNGSSNSVQTIVCVGTANAISNTMLENVNIITSSERSIVALGYPNVYNRIVALNVNANKGKEVDQSAYFTGAITVNSDFGNIHNERPFTIDTL